MRSTRLVEAAIGFTALLFLAGPAVAADAGPIVLGVPTALGTIEGQDSLRAAQLAVDEINAQGGVEVGGTKRKL
ncbi:MAG TPA: hypothetical protein VFL36_13005, partial [Myxococcales bacterium]|nr:hypothetical protein [Myxococcales bacterium]